MVDGLECEILTIFRRENFKNKRINVQTHFLLTLKIIFLFWFFCVFVVCLNHFYYSILNIILCTYIN